MADLEAAYQSHGLNNPEAPGVQISVNINYNIRLIETHASLNDNTGRRSQADMAQDMARLSLETDDSVGEGETGHRDEVGYPDEEAVPQETNQSLDIGDSVGENDQPATQDDSDEDNSWEVHSDDDHSNEDDPDEVLRTLRPAIFNLLWSLPRANLEEAQDCPVCREPFPEFPTTADEPIVLNCNHVVGFICIRNWICGGQNSCPLCRAAVVEPAALTALADRVESRGLPRPVFRTPALDVAAGSEEAAFGEQEIFIELTDEERSEVGASQPMDRSDSLWDMLISEGEVSEEQFRLIPRVYALLREIRDTREQLRTLANR